MDAMYGRTTSLKTNYMIDNKEVQAYLKKLQKTDPTDAKKWKDAFNSKGSVNNKQEYFDLLVNYIQKEKNFGTLAQEYAGTLQGQVSRIKGYWEILRADLLGIDRETGEIKNGSAFDSIKKGLDSLQEWLKRSDTKDMLDKIGQGLGVAVSAVVSSLTYLKDHVKWDEVGKKIEAVGKGLAEFINNLVNSGALDKLIEILPKLAEMSLNSKVIDAETKANQAKDIADQKPAKAAADGAFGWWEKQLNNWGFLSTDEVATISNSGNTPTIDPSGSGQWATLAMGMNNMLAGFDSYFVPSMENNKYLTSANADTYLAKNPNLTDDQRKQVKDAINEETNKGHTIYNITVGEVKTDGDVMDLINKLQNLQSNQK